MSNVPYRMTIDGQRIQAAELGEAISPATEEVIVNQGDEQIVTGHTPIGVVGGITPWNFPVLPLLTFRDAEDAIRRANDTSYGLAASVWSRDLAQAEAIASRIEAGTVWINHVHVFSPEYAFGGHEQSGVGIENSLHSLAEYSNLQATMRKPLAAA